jgi:O-antigen ligase
MQAVVSAALERFRPRPLRSGGGDHLIARAAMWAAFWAAMLLFAFVAAKVVEANPRLLAAPAALVLTTLACLRFPVPALLALVGLTAFGFSITAFLEIDWHPYFELVLAGVVVSGAVALLTRRRGAIRLWAGPGLLLVFLVLSGIATGLADNFDVAQGQFRTSHLLLALTLAVAYVPLKMTSVERLVKALILVAVAVGAYATLRDFIGPAAKETAYARLVVGPYLTVDGVETLIGSAGGSHAFSAWLAPAIPFMAVCTLWLRGSWRWLALAAAGLCMFALLGTQVRSGFAASIAGTLTAFGVLLAAAAAGGRRYVAVYAAVVACVAGAAIVATTVQSESERDGRPPSRYEAILDPSKDKAFQERLYRWENAQEEIFSKPFGHGVGVSGERGKRVQTIAEEEARLGLDNSYLKVAYEQGLLLALLLIGVFVAILFGLVRLAMTSEQAGPAFLAVASIGTLVAFAIELNFESVYIELTSVAFVSVLIGLGMRGLSRPKDDPVAG